MPGTLDDAIVDGMIVVVMPETVPREGSIRSALATHEP
jgi:hypothetical protein